jgi:hypothetical protein
MDTATAAPEGNPEEAAVGGPPSIGVPRIPVRSGATRPPSPVPSVDVPPLGEETESPVDRPMDTNVNVDVGVAGVGAVGVGPGGPGPAPEATTGAEGPGPFALAFPPGVASKLGWYVYLLVDPRSGRPFYVGRGHGDRCFRHVLLARALRAAGAEPAARARRAPPVGSDPPSERDRDPHEAPGREVPVLERINEVEAAAGPVRVEILRHGLDADQARLVEVAAHDALGLQLDPKLASQRQSASELGVRLAKRAKFKRDHQVVLLQVGGQGAEADYEKVRHGWRIGRRWTDPGSPRSPRWAVIVAGEMVVAVYGIESWEPTPVHGRSGRDAPTAAATAAATAGGVVTAPARATARAGARSSSRYSFVGVRDEELERRYVGRSVASYLDAEAATASNATTATATATSAEATTPAAGPAGAPAPPASSGVAVLNQVIYVWCGPRWESAPR